MSNDLNAEYNMNNGVNISSCKIVIKYKKVRDFRFDSLKND